MTSIIATPTPLANPVPSAFATASFAANIAAALKGAGFTGFGAPAALALVVLAVAALVGVGLTLYGNRPVAAPLAMIWGLAWIAVGRATDAPDSPTVAVGAGVAAAVIAGAALLQLVRRPADGKAR